MNTDTLLDKANKLKFDNELAKEIHSIINTINKKLDCIVEILNEEIKSKPEVK